MTKEQVQKYADKKIAIFMDKAYVNGSKYYTGCIKNIDDTTVIFETEGCTYTSEICIRLDAIVMISVSK